MQILNLLQLKIYSTFKFFLMLFLNLISFKTKKIKNRKTEEVALPGRANPNATWTERYAPTKSGV
jgi:hypothetical protein